MAQEIRLVWITTMLELLGKTTNSESMRMMQSYVRLAFFRCAFLHVMICYAGTLRKPPYTSASFSFQVSIKYP